METSKMNTIYENRKWVVMAYKHVNGTYNGTIMGKDTKEIHHWKRLNNRRNIVQYKESAGSVPQYIKDIIVETLEKEAITAQPITEVLSFL